MDAILPRIIRLAVTGSTNADAMRMALAGETLPIWVVARRQTAGRGRSGRVWVSESGNLHASLAFVCHAPISKAGELALTAGIALYDAVRAQSPLAETIGLRLKWPNDLLIGRAKAGGILVETTTARGEPGFLAVIGFGLNITSVPDDLGRAATALGQHLTVADVDGVLDRLNAQTAQSLQLWDVGRGFEAVRSAWLARAGSTGEAISVHTPSGTLTGIFKGVSETGALLTEVGGKLYTITYGDVALVADSGKDGSI